MSIARAIPRLFVLLVSTGCTYPRPVGEATTEGSGETGSSSSSGEPSSPASTTDLLTGPSTGGDESSGGGTDVTGDPTVTVGQTVSSDPTVTGDETATSDDSATGGPRPELPAGMCWSEFHGEYWCECTSRNTEPCGIDGVRVCFAQDDFVVTHEKWGPCGECAPGEQVECDVEGAPGRQFCDVASVFVEDIDDLPTPGWGECIRERDLVCEPGDTRICEQTQLVQNCIVDQGVPQWPPC